MIPPAGSSGGRRLRPPRSGRARLALGLVAAVLCLGPLAAAWGAVPSFLDQRLAGGRAAGKNPKMLMRAHELIYNDDTNTVTAQGHVQIYYGSETLLADRVVYDRRNSRVHAYGHVRLSDSNGNVVRASDANVTDNLREGFIRSLQVDTKERTQLIAASAQRKDGNVTVFDHGVYTACTCDTDAGRPPMWDIRAERIIHDQQTKTIYYQNAALEFYGHPIAWLPFLSTPDPTVKRKTGLLAPRYITSSRIGFGAEVPFFWAIKPNMDLTLAPTYLSRQGFLMKGQFRHRLSNGSYTISAAGISQQDPGAFLANDSHGTTIGAGGRRERGYVSTSGDFDINSQWSFGWNVNLLSDKWVLSDYNLPGGSWSEAVSTVHLTGQGDRNWFNLQGYYFYGLASDDVQKQLPIAAPVLDYHNIFGHPVLGGELSLRVNATSTFRQSSDVEPSSRANARLVDGTTPITSTDYQNQNLTCGTFLTNCFLPGAAGAYSRASAQVQWRRKVIDPIGGVWTPFVFAQGDLMWEDMANDPATASFLPTNPTTFGRTMAGVGLEYRYPIIVQNALGTHIIEPIGQIIVRPDETHILDHPNEDAQSLFFDDTNLFSMSKFSGWDRVEGGTRANVGLQYSWALPTGSFFSALFGQSYQIAGRNSYASPDVANTGLDSGLQNAVSDYVGGASLQVNQNLSFATHVRLDHDNAKPQAFEAEARYDIGRFSGSLLYGRFAAQPDVGLFDTREGLVGSGRVQVTDSLYVSGAARYDLDVGRFDALQGGIGFINCCMGVGFVYVADWSRNGLPLRAPDQKFLFSVSLRTLGGGGSAHDLTAGLDQSQSRALP